MERDTIPGMMDLPMTGSGLITKSTVKDFTSGQTVALTKGFGRITICMEEVSIPGKTAENTMAST